MSIVVYYLSAEDAKVLGKGYLGLEGVFPITGYQVKKGSMTVDVTVTNLDADVCIPVAEILFGERKNGGYFSLLSDLLCHVICCVV